MNIGLILWIQTDKGALFDGVFVLIICFRAEAHHVHRIVVKQFYPAVQFGDIVSCRCSRIQQLVFEPAEKVKAKVGPLRQWIGNLVRFVKWQSDLKKHCRNWSNLLHPMRRAILSSLFSWPSISGLVEMRHVFWMGKHVCFSLPRFVFLSIQSACQST